MTNKKTYIETHGLEAWEALKKKRNPTLNDLIEQFGYEEGTRKHVSRNAKRGFTLSNQIVKYGQDEGTRRYYEVLEKHRHKGTLSWYIEKYGDVEGKTKYELKNSKLSVGVNTLRANGHSEEKIEEIKANHRNRSNHNISNFIFRYGEEEGTRRYNEWVKTSKSRSKRCVDFWLSNGYNFIEASQQVSLFQSKCTLPWYIEKYGDVEGKVKYVENVSKKTYNWSKSKGPVSKLESVFFDALDHTVGIKEEGRTSKIVIKNKVFYCDYLDPATNKIIEIFGDYWHMNPNRFIATDYNKSSKKFASDIWERDTYKIQALQESGFHCLVIWETDIIKNLPEALKTAEHFLKE